MREESAKSTALTIFSGLYSSYDWVLDCATLLQDRRWKSWVAESAALKDGSSVLDIGCGTGVLEERLRGHGFLVGADLTEEMLRVAQRKRLSGMGALVVSDGEELPFKDEAFDAVISCYAVKYCSPRALVSEIARVLRPEGRLVLYDFVRPRGPLWPFNAVYAYGFIATLGRMLEPFDSGLAYTFKALPRVIASRPWERGFEEILAQCKLVEVEGKVLSGGVAMGFCARKSPALAESRPSGSSLCGGVLKSRFTNLDLLLGYPSPVG